MSVALELMIHTEERLSVRYRRAYGHGASLSFDLESRSFVIFFRDADYAARLAAAINGAVDEPSVRNARELLNQLPCDTEPDSSFGFKPRLVPVGDDAA